MGALFGFRALLRYCAAVDFQGKVVIVTGASEGIGRATALEFARLKARVVLAARTQSRLIDLEREIVAAGGDALAVPTDVADDESVAAMVRAAVDRFGGVDILINNAGYGVMGHAVDVPMADFKRVYEVNLFGVLRCTQAVVPEMRKRGGGAIVNVSSVVGRLTVPFLGAYCSTKYALNSMSDALREELRTENIRVVAVLPGRIDTRFGDNAVRHRGYRSPGNHAGAPPATVARAIVRAIRWNRRAVFAPWWYRLLPLLRNAVPGLVDRILGAAIRKQARRQ